MKYRVKLNMTHPGNFSFVCIEAPLCLDVINHTGYATKITPSILRGLRWGSLIDLDDVVDLRTGEFKQVDEEVEEPEVGESTVEESTEVIEESPVEELAEKTPAKSSRNKKSTPKEEVAK